MHRRKRSKKKKKEKKMMMMTREVKANGKSKTRRHNEKVHDE